MAATGSGWRSVCRPATWRDIPKAASASGPFLCEARAHGALLRTGLNACGGRPVCPVPTRPWRARGTGPGCRASARRVASGVPSRRPCPAVPDKWTSTVPHPCLRSCPDLRNSIPRPGCRRVPGTPGPAHRRTCPAVAGCWRTPSAPMRTDARISAPVFSECMCSRSARVCSLPVALISSDWPPHMPAAPAAAASARQPGHAQLGRPTGASASTSKASDCRASPASIAVASSKATCTVGRPRRRASSSMAGRSSCTSE